jgi:hypothetical protein
MQVVGLGGFLSSCLSAFAISYCVRRSAIVGLGRVSGKHSGALIASVRFLFLFPCVWLIHVCWNNLTSTLVVSLDK